VAVADRELDAVTGAFSYSGAAITRELVSRGRRVRTLTGHPNRAPTGTPIEVRPLAFASPEALHEALTGVDTLYNTYWVRFPHGQVTFDSAVDNSRRLFEAAAAAGVRRIVHVSITHPDLASPYPYFRGKAQVEQHLAASGVSYAIARPAILFGGDGVLINNIAWLLRRVPVVAIGGGGRYRIRGIHIDDLARLAADLGSATDNSTVDAVGPESLPFRDLIGCIRTAVGSHSLVVPVPGFAFPALTTVVGALLRDRLLTRDEYWAMANGMADSDAPSTGRIVLSEWIAENADTLGRTYAHEIRRHFRAG
jgi:NADH dehydrogenase